MIRDGEVFWGWRELYAAMGRIETVRDAATFQRIAARSPRGRHFLGSPVWLNSPWARPAR